jgi:hypothetical protein
MASQTTVAIAAGGTKGTGCTKNTEKSIFPHSLQVIEQGRLIVGFAHKPGDRSSFEVRVDLRIDLDQVIVCLEGFDEGTERVVHVSIVNSSHCDIEILERSARKAKSVVSRRDVK